MKHRVTRFKDLTVALQELKPFVRDGRHLQSGRPFKSFGDMRSREVLANWLVCAAINSTGEKTVTFSSDPIGGDGVIIDIATKETWQTEHVMVPRYRSGQAANTRTRILEAIDKKRSKGGTAYARGKTLIVFLDGGGGTLETERGCSGVAQATSF